MVSPIPTWFLLQAKISIRAVLSRFFEVAVGETESQVAAALITRDILSGVLPPSGKLKVRDLSIRYTIGPTPLREALSRLAARGLVEQRGQRGFRVPPVTREHLLDITHTRQIVEADAFRLAIEHGDQAWEDEVSASLHILRRTAERQVSTDAWLDEYEARHHRFHRALIAACPFATLRRFCDELYEQKTRYRRFLKSLGRPLDDVVHLHERLADCAISRDSVRGTAEIASHIGSTAKSLLIILDAT